MVNAPRNSHVVAERTAALYQGVGIRLCVTEWFIQRDYMRLKL
jgi:hypothetical protein